MAQAMVDINDIIKPASKNVHILITFQLQNLQQDKDIIRKIILV